VIQQVSSRSNPRVKLAASLKSTAQCRKSRRFLVEGPRFIKDMVFRNDPLEYILLSDTASADSVRASELALLENLTVLRIPENVYRDVSSTEHSQGIAAVAPLPCHELSAVFNGGTVLVLDGVSDPGNAGTAIRSAAAFACSGAVFLSGSVFPWGSKVTRASAGLNSLLPIVEVTSIHEFSSFAADYRFLGACAGTGDIREISPGKPVCLIVGSEAHGLSEGVESLIDEKISIKMTAEVESLNAGVSASIILHSIFEMNS
jgi:TrmH family RNA methyltransferase